jgi:hypothetical protein
MTCQFWILAMFISLYLVLFIFICRQISLLTFTIISALLFIGGLFIGTN